MTEDIVNVQDWATAHIGVFYELSAGMAVVTAALNRATEVGLQQGDTPDLHAALDEAARAGTAFDEVVERALVLPTIPDAKTEQLFRDMLALRREWARGIAEAAPRLDPEGMERANRAGDLATRKGAAIEEAMAGAWPSDLSLE